MLAAGIHELGGKLVRKREMQSKASSFIEICRNRGAYKALELIAHNIEWLHPLALAPLLGRGPEIRKHKRCKGIGIFRRDLAALGCQGNKNDMPLLQSHSQIE